MTYRIQKYAVALFIQITDSDSPTGYNTDMTICIDLCHSTNNVAPSTLFSQWTNLSVCFPVSYLTFFSTIFDGVTRTFFDIFGVLVAIDTHS
mmetsp:Transcript_16959/g.18659  ORF Transcript_16959/g.18659 Transcript_16959/m.18659 type:complete len:92 (-) Transcript_16959:2466-2741(-)